MYKNACVQKKLKAISGPVLRNMIFHTLDGAFFMAAMVFLDQFTIMLAFIRQVVNDPLMISLIPAAVAVGFNTPGLFSAPLMRKLRIPHLFLSVAGIFQRLMILFLALFTKVMTGMSPMQAGLTASMFYFLFAAVGGTTGPAWLDLLARTIPSNYRARVVAVRNAAGAGAGVVFPVAIGLVLMKFDFPRNYRYLFLAAFLLLILSLLSFIMIRDVPPAAEPEGVRRTGYREFIRTIRKRDPNFFRFLAGRILFAFAAVSLSYFTLWFFKRNPGQDDAVVAGFALALNISKVLSGLLLGVIGDRKGNLLVLQIGILAMIVSNLTIWLMPGLPMIYISFVLLGIVLSADINTYQAFITEFGNEQTRIYYAAVANSLAGTLAGILPILVGALLSRGILSWSVLFLFCSAAGVFCWFVFRFWVRDPRHMAARGE
jgi:MFS family permease